ncbi:MAG TPA: AAA family ATPase [Stellaceae bacterium]|nr:AAA family ATPase [Stellaceae bacterium]
MEAKSGQESPELAAAALRDAIQCAGMGLIERGVLVENIVLAAVAGEHLLVIGPPGTAKSEAVRRVAQSLGGRYFEYLLGRFTEPNEVFGPVDLRKLREGLVETETTGMLPEAEIAFLDEIFLGSTAILNTLLGILNERVFRRGHTRMHCPLRVCVGASNGLPADEMLAAFADRFLIRVFLDPIPDPRIEELLEGGWRLTGSPLEPRSGIHDIDLLAKRAREADLTSLRPALAQAIRRLRHAGIALTDRRAVKVQRLIAAAAALDGRSTPTEADIWPIVLAVPAREQQTVAREALRDLLDATENAALPTAAEDASQGPLARAARLVACGAELLAARPADSDIQTLEAWQLRLEGVAREIDAGFAADSLPGPLSDVRARIVAIVQEAAGTPAG